MPELVRYAGLLVLLLLFGVCIWMSSKMVDPKRRAVIVCTGCAGAVVVLWLTAYHAFLITHKSMMFFSAGVGTFVAVVGCIRTIAQSRANTAEAPEDE